MPADSLNNDNLLEAGLSPETIATISTIDDHLRSLGLRSSCKWIVQLVLYDGIPLVFRYVDPNRIKSCLPEIGDGTLRATQPAALNDPNECAIQAGAVESCEESGNSELAQVLTNIHPQTPVHKNDVADARNDFGSLFIRKLVQNQLSNRFGIISFATDPQHHLMWSHYASNYTGFVIGYDFLQLLKLSKKSSAVRPIRYNQEISRFYGYSTINEENLFALLSIKSKDWKYEQEWRLIVDLHDTIGTGNDDENGFPINLVRIPNEAVHQVYFTERTPVDTVNEIEKRLSNPNNRYGTTKPIKLLQSARKYEFETMPSQPPRIIFTFGASPR